MAGQPLMYGDEDGRAPAVPPPRPEQTYDTAESTCWFFRGCFSTSTALTRPTRSADDTADQLPGGQFAYGGGAAPTYGEASSSAGYVYGDNGDSVCSFWGRVGPSRVTNSRLNHPTAPPHPPPPDDTAEGGLPMPQARPPMTCELLCSCCQLSAVANNPLVPFASCRRRRHHLWLMLPNPIPSHHPEPVSPR